MRDGSLRDASLPVCPFAPGSAASLPAAVARRVRRQRRLQQGGPQAALGSLRGRREVFMHRARTNERRLGEGQGTCIYPRRCSCRYFGPGQYCSVAEGRAQPLYVSSPMSAPPAR
jgi:hypothetical protein